MEHFKELAHVWWDKNSSIKTLQTMTPIRMQLLKKDLKEIGMINKDDVNPKKPFKNLKILDVGCGGGFVSEAMAKLGANVIGIDASPDVIRVAKEHMQGNLVRDSNLKYENVTVEEFALENRENFDVVVSSEVIEHVLDKEMFADNALRCLRPGGSAFFTTMNRTLVSGFYYI